MEAYLKQSFFYENLQETKKYIKTTKLLQQSKILNKTRAVKKLFEILVLKIKRNLKFNYLKCCPRGPT